MPQAPVVRTAKSVADWPTGIPGNFPVGPKVMVHHFDSFDYVLGLSGYF